MSILDSARQLTEEGEAHTVLTNAMEMEDDTEWVTDVYSQLNGTPARNTSTRWQRLNKYRLSIGLVSLLLVGLGVALVIPRSSCVSSLLPSTGTDCASVTTVSYITAGLLCLTGLLGCLATYKGLRVTLSCCLAVMFFCYAVLCGAAAASVVYSRLHQLDNLESAWARLASTSPPMLCDVQMTLHCSGFAEGQCCKSAPLMLAEESEEVLYENSVLAAVLADKDPPCFFEAPNGSTYDVHDHSEITWPAKMCVSSCGEASNGGTTVTCEAPLKLTVKAYFYHFVFMFSGLTVLFVGLGCVTIAGMLWKPYIDSRMEHRF